MGQKYASYLTDPGPVTGFYDSDESPVPDGVTTIEISDEQRIECTNNPGWTVANGELVAPVPPTAKQMAWEQYQIAAKTALAASDITVLRCFENGVALPLAWATYRKTLRAIVSATSGDASQPLPARPAYPSGT